MICPDMLAGKRVLFITDGINNISDIITCFKTAGCEISVGNFDDVTDLDTQVPGRFGDPDILVICNGRFSSRPMQDIDGDSWASNVELPLRTAYLCCRYFSEGMIVKGWGRIILISAVQAKTGGWNTGGDVGYGTLTMSLCGLARSLAVELASSGITVNSVLPMLDYENVDHIKDTVPLDVLPDVTDVGGAALFLASERASFITGYSLDINCGLYMD